MNLHTPGMERPAGDAGPQFIDFSNAPNQRPDFAAINKDALPFFPALLRRWLPGGRTEGSEYVALNPTRDDAALA